MATVGKRKKTGARKYKSGAQKRRERREREEAATDEVLSRARDLGIPIAGGDEDEPPGHQAWAAEFTAAGDPDLDNPDTDLAYVRRLQLIVWAVGGRPV